MEQTNPDHATPDAHSNGVSSHDELAQIRAQLMEEESARAAAETARDQAATAIAQRDAHIVELEQQLVTARTALDSANDNLVVRNGAYATAIESLQAALCRANPHVPPELITGASPAELESSVTKAANLVDRVRAQLAAEKATLRVPAGAPPAETPSLDSLSARDKIAAGVRPQSK